MNSLIETSKYCYRAFAKALHIEQKIIVSNDQAKNKNEADLYYFQKEPHAFHFNIIDDGVITLYQNNDLLARVLEPKPFRITGIFSKAKLVSQCFENKMQFNQWCFDNQLTHKLLKNQIQINLYYDALIIHPITGILCLPPILFAKQNPNLNISSSLPELLELEPILIQVKKGQSIHFDKYHYQCHYNPILHFSEQQ